MGTVAGSICSLDLGSVAVGTARPPFDFAVLVDSPVGAGVEQIFNTVSVADDGTSGTDLNPADNTASDQTPLDLGGGTGPDLVILKDDGGITVDPGDTITYAISVENVGNQHATGVVVSETVPEDTVFLAGSSDPAWSCLSTTAGSSCSLDLGSVAVGTARLPFDFTVLVDSPVGAGVEQIFNTASVGDDGSGGTDLDPTNNMSTDSTPLAGATAPDLQLTKDDGDATVGAGEIVAYTLTIANAGNQDATGVLLADDVPANTTFEATASDAGWSCVGSTCTLDVGDLGAGDPAQSFVVAFRVDDPLAAAVTQIANSATAADDGASGPDLNPDDNAASDTTPIDSGPSGTGPDLQLTKDDGDATVGAGEIVAYTLTIANAGNQDATGVVLADDVPANTTFEATASDAGWSCVGSTCTLDVGDLGAGDPAQSFVVAFRVDDPLAAGVTQIANSATAADDGASGPDLFLY
ncbi:MAG: DUF11 domain-containing protein [Colwellia sp.]|nr:DUF11 domain-containing protein [Colwellia sp.]